MREEFENITIGMLTRALPGVSTTSHGEGESLTEILEGLAVAAFQSGRLKITGDGTLVEHFPFPSQSYCSTIRVYEKNKEVYSLFAPNEREAEAILGKLAERRGGWL